VSRRPQGDATIAVRLPDGHAETILGLLTSERVSAALARVFLIGATARERAVRKGKG
jgi:hypothetical protein